MPRLKPPLPVEVGLLGKPTLVQNVETIACVPPSCSAARSTGSASWPREPGTKLYCVSGHVARPGVYELPLGASLRRLLEVAGGATGQIKAFSPGGASSGFLPAAALDLPLDFGHLSAAGSMLGSAGVVVLNDTVDMREAALEAAALLRGRELRAVRAVPHRDALPARGAATRLRPRRTPTRTPSIRSTQCLVMDERGLDLRAGPGGPAPADERVEALPRGVPEVIQPHQITLEGRTVAFEPGETVLEVAQRLGIEIPTLCHDPRLDPAGACRICLVEVEGVRRMQPACAYPAVAGGWSSRTETDASSRAQASAARALR